MSAVARGDRALRPLDRRARRGARARGAALGPALARAGRAPLRGAARRRRRRALCRRGLVGHGRAPSLHAPRGRRARRRGHHLALLVRRLGELRASTRARHRSSPTSTRGRFNLDPAAVEAAITPRTKAIVAVDIFGYPCELDELRAICDRHGLALVEDACEALGARYKGRLLGSHGHPAVFAFYPNKQITTGEGGAVTTGSAAEHELLVSLRNQGRLETSSWLQHGRLGFNYRLDDLSAALGIGQLEKLDRILAGTARRSPAATTSCSTAVEVETPLADDADHVRSWFVYVVKLPAGLDRDRRDGGARRGGHRLRAVPALDPPPVLHARAVRLRRGALPGERGRERAHPRAPLPRTARA